MAWRIEFDPSAEKDLSRLGSQAAQRILRFLSERLAKLGELWKYRVGDYRIIADIEDGLLRILVVRIGNRRDVYKR